MKIVKLQIKNFLSIADAEIHPGAVNQIVGNNNQGKTTVLKALEVALKGSTDGSLVKHGTDQAEIIVEFENELSVRRRLRADGKQDVTVKKGEFKADSPQAMLNSLLTAGVFNPLDLLDPKVRSEALLKAIDIRLDASRLAELAGETPVPLPPVDFGQHGLKVVDQAFKYFYMRRAEANREAKAKLETHRVKLAELPPMPAPEHEDVKAEDIKAEILENRGLVAKEREKVESFKAKQYNQQMLKKDIEDRERQRVQLENQLGALCTSIKVAKDKLAGLEDELKAVEPNDGLVQQLTERNQVLQQELTRRAENASLLERKKSVDALGEIAKEAQEFSAKLDAVVERLGAGAKAQLMASAELPIQGLTYEEGEFRLDGCAIDNLSSSKALKLGVAIARKLAGGMKLICIDGAELLDVESYETLRNEIEGDGFTYFITKVGPAFQHAGDQVLEMQAGAVVGGAR